MTPWRTEYSPTMDKRNMIYAGDRFIGATDHEEDATRIVEAVNAQIPATYEKTPEDEL